ncbi:hypothetical protein EVAR_41685_1 [Eumeta japonica]|uniref:Uncharacterized protein n=1 Tax=Eumeta variegata TaxID=151549 RepID=A0A4C1VS17_EUMVA|nr:hypothetical protein EVAR_41685_1 [Eumeta japonica]
MLYKATLLLHTCAHAQREVALRKVTYCEVAPRQRAVPRPGSYRYLPTAPVLVAAGSHFESVTLGNVTMSHRTREPAECLRLSHSTMIGLPRAQH